MNPSTKCIIKSQLRPRTRNRTAKNTVKIPSSVINQRKQIWILCIRVCYIDCLVYVLRHNINTTSTVVTKTINYFNCIASNSGIINIQ
jgi:hypothetical protein